ncbi:hypothetical protein AtubIFM57258_008443, partial [Aspergillus tubingensis]
SINWINLIESQMWSPLSDSRDRVRASGLCDCSWLGAHTSRHFDRIWLLVRLDRPPLYPGSMCMTAHARLADLIHLNSYTDISGDSMSSTE